MKDYKRIIFVSDSDTCEGPMAAGVFRKCLLKHPMEVDCKGLVCLFPEPVNEKAEAVMISNGIRQENHTAEQLTEEDFTDDTMIVALAEEEFKSIYEKFDHCENVFLLEGLIKEPVNISNPYGKSLADYGQCFEEIQSYVEKLAMTLNEGESKNEYGEESELY